MAEVFKAYDIEASRHVAVKLFSNDSLEDEILREAFDREVRALKELHHPNIVELFDSGIDAATQKHYLILEWMDSDLWTARNTSPFQGWDSFYLEIGRPLLKALAFAHSRQVVHRDVKPKNILLDSSGSYIAFSFESQRITIWSRYCHA